MARSCSVRTVSPFTFLLLLLLVLVANGCPLSPSLPPGDCTAPGSDGTSCDDGDACTEPDTCVNATCGGSVLDCDDGLECTSDDCAPETGCKHNIISFPCPEPQFCLEEFSDCDDGLFCTTGEECRGGRCRVVIADGLTVPSGRETCPAGTTCDEENDRCIPSAGPETTTEGVRQQKDLITSVTIDPPVPQIGEDVLVTVEAVHPIRPDLPVAVRIDGARGTRRYLHFPGAPGKRTVYVDATTDDGFFDYETREIDVVEAEIAQSNLAVRAFQNPFEPFRVDFLVKNASTFSDGRFIFAFGDGSTQSVSDPWVSHSYADKISHAEPTTAFEVLVTESISGLQTRTTLSFPSIYFQQKNRKRIVSLPVSATPLAPIAPTLLYGAYTLTNPEPQILTLRTATLEYQPCNPAQRPAYKSVSIGLATTPALTAPSAGLEALNAVSPRAPVNPRENVQLGAEQRFTFHLLLASGVLPPDTCVLGLHVTGDFGDRTHAAASVYFVVRQRNAAATPVSDHFRAFFNELRERNLVDRAAQISYEDLYELELHGQIRRVGDMWEIIR